MTAQGSANPLHVIILAGGAGTRFWPLSRRARPKQLLPLWEERSLLESTLRRVEGLVPAERVWVQTRPDLLEAVRAQLPHHPEERIIAEPEGRDTAPGLVYGCVRVERVDPEATVLVLPADHVIPDAEAFRECVRGAVGSLEEADGLVTFGVTPTYPATGFGYVRRRLDHEGVPAGPSRSYPVERFREKPKEATAREYLAAGGYYWNAGIFLWRLATLRGALEECAPDLAQGWSGLRELGDALDEDGDGAVRACFQALPRTSIDYALLEKAEDVRVVEATFSWDDVGSWSALRRFRAADGEGNVVDGRSLLEEAKGCTVVSQGGRLVALLGVEDLVVVDTPEVLLVCPLDRAEEVKKLVDRARSLGWDEVL